MIQLDWVHYTAFAVLLILLYRKYGTTGQNRAAVGVDELLDSLQHKKTEDWHSTWKSWIVKKSKDEYDALRIYGEPKIPHYKTDVSKGYPKMLSIISLGKLKLEGTVLDLCAGRGGFAQAACLHPKVTKVESYTLGPAPGHQGHEAYTDKVFAGMEKWERHYADIATIPNKTPDWLFFDGGEMYPQAEKEADKFHNLLRQAIRHVHPDMKGFVIKILVPTDPRNIQLCERVRHITGKGLLLRPPEALKNSMEVYLISHPNNNQDYGKYARAILTMYFKRKLEGERIPLIREQLQPEIDREEVPDLSYGGKSYNLKPLNMTLSIKQLGTPIHVPGTAYLHWRTLGTYVGGSLGTKATNRIPLIQRVLGSLLPTIPGITFWKTTDTTPEGFQKVFKTKVDKPPMENHKHKELLKMIYVAMASYFRKHYNYRELTWTEVLERLNRQGAASRSDYPYTSVGEFVSRPLQKWAMEVEQVRNQLDYGTPTNAVFTTIGKREKKATMGDQKGSRMVAFLPIPMRILETKIFGPLMDIVKPTLCDAGVGGLGLHDLGMRLWKQWRVFAHPAACSSDIAGFDTKVSMYTLQLEYMFCCLLGITSVTAKNLYRIYAHPHILVPQVSEYARVELLQGRGQRMSGTQVTYPMNTITRMALTILQLYTSKRQTLTPDQFVLHYMRCRLKARSCISGDDEVLVGEKDTVKEYARNGKVLNEIGFTRKDILAAAPSAIHHTFSEIEFCSHHYEYVTYYNHWTRRTVYRYQPTRTVAEILGKAVLRVGGDSAADLDNEAWISAQGNALFVLYHHIPIVRFVASVYKSISRPNLILTEQGGVFKHKPWVREGDIRDICNDVLFGRSCKYKPRDAVTHKEIEGFEISAMRNLGYLLGKRVHLYDPVPRQAARVDSKRLIIKTVMRLANENSSLDTGFMDPYLH